MGKKVTLINRPCDGQKRSGYLGSSFKCGVKYPGSIEK